VAEADVDVRLVGRQRIGPDRRKEPQADARMGPRKPAQARRQPQDGEGDRHADVENVASPTGPKMERVAIDSSLKAWRTGTR
jgi:hypothetical protein